MKSKKAAASGLTIKVIVIIFFIIAALFFYGNIFSDKLDVSIDERKLEAQIIEKKILNCFVEKGIVDTNKITQENLDNCHKVKENSYVKIEVKGKIDPIYSQKEEEKFAKKKKLCNLPNSNIECYELNYPILADNTLEKINIEIIV